MFSRIAPCLMTIWVMLTQATAQGAERAGIAPSADQRAAPDQSLQSAGAKRAEALAHYIAGEMALDGGHQRDALDHFLKALEADPANPTVAAQAAQLSLLYQGRDAALQLLEAQIKSNPERPECYSNLIRFCLTNARGDNALFRRGVAAADEALKRFPDAPESVASAVSLHLALAQMDSADGAKTQRARAAQILETTAKRDTGDAAHWLGLGRVAQDVWPLADAEHRKERLPKINEFYEKALQRAMAAGDAESALVAADYFLLSNQLERSLAINEELVKRGSNLEARKRVVRLFDAMDRHDDSFAALEELVKAFPNDVEHRRMLAQALLKKGDADTAAVHLEAALQAGGGDLQSYLELCAVLNASRKPEKFHQFTQRAAQLYDGEPRILLFHGVALNGIKKYAEAATLFESIEKKAETRATDHLDYDFYFSHGVALERSGRFEEASKKFERSIDLTPVDKPQIAANAMNYLGYMWLEKDMHLDKAEELIRKANELRDPPAASIVDSLGWVIFKRGRYEEALKELLRAESLQKDWDSEDAEILDHIAQTYEKLNNKAKAQEYWKRTLDLKPSNEDVRKHAEKALGITPAPKPPKPEEK